jgi:hypothetical protein
MGARAVQPSWCNSSPINLKSTAVCGVLCPEFVMLKKVTTALWIVLVAFGPFGGIAIGFVLSNCYESWKHNVSFHDAAFIESWHQK